MDTAQDTAPQMGESLSDRLKRAYERVSPNLRYLARQDFCEVHIITEDTFRKKRNGQATVTEQECEWMEDYRPYSKLARL